MGDKLFSPVAANASLAAASASAKKEELISRWHPLVKKNTHWKYRQTLKKIDTFRPAMQLVKPETLKKSLKENILPSPRKWYDTTRGLFVVGPALFWIQLPRTYFYALAVHGMIFLRLPAIW